MNARRKDVPHKQSLPAARPTRYPVEEYSESEREESEYESEGEDIETTPLHKREEELDSQDEYDEEEAEEEAGGANRASEEDEDEEPRRRVKETAGSSLKRKEIDSDWDSPPRKIVHRRKAIVFDSDEEVECNGA